MDRQAREQATKQLMDTLGVLREYMRDSTVNELMVNRFDQIWIERAGQVFQADAKLPQTSVQAAIKLLSRIANIDSSLKNDSALLNSRIEGFRVAGLLAPFSVHGDSLSIRRHSDRDISLADYEAADSFRVDPALQGQRNSMAMPDLALVRQGGAHLTGFLRWLVKTKRNCIVSGGTSSGKTTFLKALLAQIDSTERVLTIEDTAELRVLVPNHVSFEANAQSDITIRKLVRHALRYNPDRIIVGEVRDGAAYDLIQALNTGHAGGFCTLHADNTLLALTKLENLVLQAGVDLPLPAIRSQIAQTFHTIVQMSEWKGMRFPEQIALLTGLSNDGSYEMTTVFRKDGAY